LALTPAQLCELLAKVDEGTLSNLNAKTALSYMLDTGVSVAEAITAKGLVQVSDNSILEKIVDEVIAGNTAVVEQIKAGKASALGFLVGEAMKRSKGQANPKILGELFRRRLLNA